MNTQPNPQHTIDEALMLLSFLQDICTAWDFDAVEFEDEAMRGIVFLLAQVEQRIKQTCVKSS